MRLRPLKPKQGRIRPVASEDAEAILDLYCSVVEEDAFFATSVQDRCRTLEEQQHFIQKALKQRNSAAWVCCVNDEVVGSIFVLGGELLRTLHRAELEVQVSKHHRGLGIGRALMHTAISALRQNRLVNKLALVPPTAAKRWGLYQELGFGLEGEIGGAFKEPTGQYKSEIMMGLWV